MGNFSGASKDPNKHVSEVVEIQKEQKIEETERKKNLEIFFQSCKNGYKSFHRTQTLEKFEETNKIFKEVENIYDSLFCDEANESDEEITLQMRKLVFSRGICSKRLSDILLKEEVVNEETIHEFQEQCKEDLHRVLNLGPDDITKRKIFKTLGELCEESSEGIKYFTKALQVPGNYENTYLIHAYRGIRYKKLKKYREAILDFSKSIELNERDESYRMECYLYRGRCYCHDSDFHKALQDLEKSLKADWEDGIKSKLRNYMADCYIGLKQIVPSLYHLQMAIKLNDKRTKLYVKRGELFMHKEMYEKAVEDFTNAILLDNTDEDVVELRGDCLKELGIFQKAIEDYSRVLELDKDDEDAYLKRAKCYLSCGEYKNAIQDFSCLISMVDDEIDLSEMYRERGECCMFLGELKKALQDFSKSLELNEDNTESYLARARCKIAMGDIDVAIVDIKLVEYLIDEDCDISCCRGEYYFAKKMFENAIADFTTSIRIDEFCSRAYFGRAECYISMFKQKEGIEEYKLIITKFKDREREREKARKKLINLYVEEQDVDVLIAKGKCFMLLTMFKEAIDVFSKVLDVDSTNIEAIYERGVSYIEVFMHEKGKNDLEKVLMLNDQKPYEKVLFHLASCYLELENFKLAKEFLDKYIFLNRNDEKAYFLRADCYENLNEYEKGITDCTVAIELNEYCLHGFFVRGNCFRKLEKYSEAIDDFTKCIHLCDIYYEIGVPFLNKDQMDKYNMYELRGECYSELKMHQKSVSDYSMILEVYKDRDVLYFCRGLEFMKLKKYENAIEDITRAIKLEEQDHYYFRRGECHKSLKKNSKAIEDFQHLIENNQLVLVSNFLVGIVLMEMGRLNEAVEYFTAAINAKWEACLEMEISLLTAIVSQQNIVQIVEDDEQREIGEREVEVVLLVNRGDCYVKLEEGEKASDDFNVVLRTIEESNVNLYKEKLENILTFVNKTKEEEESE